MNAHFKHMIGQRLRSAAPQEALAARRGREPGGGVLVSRGRALVLAAVLVVIACGCLAAQADAFVYWSNDLAIGRANLDGSGVNQNLFGVGLYPAGVAVDRQHIYWTNPGTFTIGRANLDGSDADKSFITATSQAVAVDGQHIYWTDPGASTIGRANLDGSGVDPSFITGANYPQGVAVDGQHIYWADPVAGTIGRANLDGSGVDPSFIATGRALGVAVDAQHIYWTSDNPTTDTGTIGRANLDGSDVDPSFITGMGLSFGVAVDAQHIYWTDFNVLSNAGTIGRANLDGSGVDDSFVVDAGFTKGVAVDALPLAPSASITTPAAGATYRVGQAVESSFGCSDGAGGTGIASCLDQSGRPAGAAIDTNSPGSHTFTVTATSSDGRTQSASSTYTVVPGPARRPPSGPGRARGPRLRDLRASRHRWREGDALPHISSETDHTTRQRVMGTTFSFTLNQPATIRLAFTRQASGRAVGVKDHRECIARSKHNPQRLRCVHTVNAAGLSLKARSGADKIAFAGRVSPTHKLRPGTYTTTVTATNARGERSAPESLRFTIVN